MELPREPGSGASQAAGEGDRRLGIRLRGQKTRPLGVGFTCVPSQHTLRYPFSSYSSQKCTSNTWWFRAVLFACLLLVRAVGEACQVAGAPRSGEEEKYFLIVFGNRFRIRFVRLVTVSEATRGWRWQSWCWYTPLRAVFYRSVRSVNGNNKSAKESLPNRRPSMAAGREKHFYATAACTTKRRPLMTSRDRGEGC
ncbi:purine catabolism regulatory protein [Anopheles sinensis]|uniref:Purine catabolism regulatory protein n=1 Tax=Anopheles sinensis TaxID=74873 RepID=A0A084WTW9_ANOSI|nr:purine catabolism regulatory protein [Anopheles sinensis]